MPHKTWGDKSFTFLKSVLKTMSYAGITAIHMSKVSIAPIPNYILVSGYKEFTL